MSFLGVAEAGILPAQYGTQPCGQGIPQAQQPSLILQVRISTPWQLQTFGSGEQVAVATGIGLA